MDFIILCLKCVIGGTVLDKYEEIFKDVQTVKPKDMVTLFSSTLPNFDYEKEKVR